MAAQIGAAVSRVAHYEQTVTSLTETYQAEIYTQVYEAQVQVEYEKMTQELSLAGKIQASFLPDDVPDITLMIIVRDA